MSRGGQTIVVVAVALAVFLVSWFILDDVHSNARDLTNAELTCTTNLPLGYSEKQFDSCFDKVPTYAERPLLYAAIAGATVLVVGRGYLFMRRLEEQSQEDQRVQAGQPDQGERWE